MDEQIEIRLPPEHQDKMDEYQEEWGLLLDRKIPVIEFMNVAMASLIEENLALKRKLKSHEEPEEIPF